MLETQDKQLSEWREELRAYEKGKRTKMPHGKSLPRIKYVSHREVLEKESQFNPILQTYTDPRKDISQMEACETRRKQSLLRQINKEKKYLLPYDIINLHGSEACPQDRPIDPNRKLGPVRNVYNVINNRPLPLSFFGNREVKLNLQKSRHLVKSSLGQYDAVLGVYRNSNVEKQRVEQDQMRRSAWQQYESTRKGKYYDLELEKKEKQKEQLLYLHRRESSDRKLPPSYVMKESVLIGDRDVPPVFRTLDQQKQNSKRRYQRRYLIEDEYQRRNEEQEERSEAYRRNHVHDNRIWEQKAKEFNIINSQNYPTDRADQLYGRKPSISSWQTIEAPHRFKVKSGGFS